MRSATRKPPLRSVCRVASLAIGLLAAVPGFAQDGQTQTVPPETPEAVESPATIGAPAITEPEPASGDAAYGAYQRGLFLTAFLRATDRLERDPNDAAAMTLLGELHAQGLGIPQDFGKAAEWYRLAARRGDANAAFALGSLALEGRGMERDPDLARRHFEEAAEQGHAPAAYNLALMLLNDNTAESIEQAALLLDRAAEAEIPDAQHALGVLYARGRGVQEDEARAAALFRRAAENGSLAGAVEYAIALFNGVGVAKDEAEAAEYFRRAAFRGNAIAQNRLARLHVAGRGVEVDLVEAATWHLLASSQGLTDTWLDDALDELSEADEAEAERRALERMDA
ncbi:MAG TPA: tetratricopeptide repeat protein [Saliniramus sp.]|nr:tetratricopeptide repeat protein [Saliniramus sp.]